MANVGTGSGSRRIGSEGAAGSAIANTVTATNLYTAHTIPGGTLNVGDVIVQECRVGYGVTGTPDITLNAVVNGTAVLSSGALTTAAAGQFMAQLIGVVRAIGASGSILWEWVVQSNDSGLNAVVVDTTADSVDTNADITLATSLTWSAASASNTATPQRLDTRVR